MSVIKMDWECPACLSSNELPVRKPSKFAPALVSTSCKYCKSLALIRILKPDGTNNRVAYEFIDFEVSDSGRLLISKRQTTPPKAE